MLQKGGAINGGVTYPSNCPDSKAALQRFATVDRRHSREPSAPRCDAHRGSGNADVHADRNAQRRRHDYGRHVHLDRRQRVRHSSERLCNGARSPCLLSPGRFREAFTAC